MTLSLVIIVKNGEKGIEGAIRSASEIVDEIVVVDSGSTDRTVEIAKKYTKKVFERPFKNDFSELRNFALSKATGDWILALDADEILSQEASKTIAAQFFHCPRNSICESLVNGYWFRRRWYYDDGRYLKHGLFYPDYQLRLFRNRSEYRYIHRVHEELTIPKEKTKEVALDIYHYNSGQKQLRSYTKLASLDFKDLKKPSWWYLWKTVYTFIDMFFVGLIRGKGVLDGWVGIKAHFLFASSISKAYWEVLWL